MGDDITFVSNIWCTFSLLVFARVYTAIQKEQSHCGRTRYLWPCKGSAVVLKSDRDSDLEDSVELVKKRRKQKAISASVAGARSCLSVEGTRAVFRALQYLPRSYLTTQHSHHPR